MLTDKTSEHSAQLAADSSVDDGKLDELTAGESGGTRKLRPEALLETLGMGAA